MRAGIFPGTDSSWDTRLPSGLGGPGVGPGSSSVMLGLAVREPTGRQVWAMVEPVGGDWKATAWIQNDGSQRDAPKRFHVMKLQKEGCLGQGRDLIQPPRASELPLLQPNGKVKLAAEARRPGWGGATGLTGST